MGFIFINVYCMTTTCSYLGKKIVHITWSCKIDNTCLFSDLLFFLGTISHVNTEYVINRNSVRISPERNCKFTFDITSHLISPICGYLYKAYKRCNFQRITNDYVVISIVPLLNRFRYFENLEIVFINKT